MASCSAPPQGKFKGTKIIGVDLGTGFSACSHVDEANELQTVKGKDGSPLFDSAVAFHGPERVVGKMALELKEQYPDATLLRYFKRLVHKNFKDLSSEDVEALEYTVEPTMPDGSGLRIPVNWEESKYVTVPEVSAAVLSLIVRQVEDNYPGMRVRACVTVPHGFTHGQRKGTLQAGEIAGLPGVVTLSEPVAACIRLGYRQPWNSKTTGVQRLIMVVDMGTGTLDVSVVSAFRNVFDVLGTSGDAKLGGKDYTDALLQHVRATQTLGANVDPVKLRNACEAAKLRLALGSSARLVVEGIAPFVITRTQADLVWKPLWDRLQVCLDQAEGHARLNKKDFDRTQLDMVALVGGSARLYAMRPQVDAWTGKGGAPHVRATTVDDPDLIVSQGAALYAATLFGEEASTSVTALTVNDLLPHGLGVDMVEDSRYPHDRKLLGVVLDKQQPTPCNHTRRFETVVDNATNINFIVREGERYYGDENEELGRFTIGNLPKQPKGKVKVDVTFSVSTYGNLTVMAQEVDNPANKVELECVNPLRLTTAEILAARRREELLAAAQVLGDEELSDAAIAASVGWLQPPATALAPAAASAAAAASAPVASQNVTAPTRPPPPETVAQPPPPAANVALATALAPPVAVLAPPVAALAPAPAPPVAALAPPVAAPAPAAEAMMLQATEVQDEDDTMDNEEGPDLKRVKMTDEEEEDIVPADENALADEIAPAVPVRRRTPAKSKGRRR